jgi:hypothetical protein
LCFKYFSSPSTRWWLQRIEYLFRCVLELKNKTYAIRCVDVEHLQKIWHESRICLHDGSKRNSICEEKNKTSQNIVNQENKILFRLTTAAKIWNCWCLRSCAVICRHQVQLALSYAADLWVGVEIGHWSA